ncbi:MAG: ATP-binding protein [Clostridiales bacterium]|nr:ATP-binding protein [Clostridiales bacterium]
MLHMIINGMIHYYPNLLLLLVLVSTFPGKSPRQVRGTFPVFFLLLCGCDYLALRFSERGTFLLELRGISLLLLYIFLAFCFARVALEGWWLYQLTVITMWWFFYGVARSILFAAAQVINPALEVQVLPVLLVNDILQTLFSVFLCRLRVDSTLRIKPAVLYCVCLLSVFVEELIIAADDSYAALNELHLLRMETAVRVSLVLIVIFMYWCISMLLRQLENLFLREHQVAMQKMELDFAGEIHRQSRKTAHDMKNHLMIMESLLEKQQYSELEKYMKDYSRENQTFLYAASSGNTTVDAVLFREQNKAKNLGIPFTVHAALPGELHFSMTEFSSFLFNSIDNAIEASTAVEDPEIQVSVQMKESFCLITVTNKVQGKVLEKNPRLQTTKSAGALHGYGTRIMRDFARKYNGDLQFSQEGDRFTVSLMIQEGQEDDL